MDSIYSALNCNICCVIACSLLLDELDSFMFQTVGHEGVAAYAEAMHLPLYRRVTSGLAVKKELVYSPEAGDEVEDLYQLLKTVKVSGSESAVFINEHCLYCGSYCMDVRMHFQIPTHTHTHTYTHTHMLMNF